MDDSRGALDLKSLSVTQTLSTPVDEPTALTAIAISQSGTYFAVGDVDGRIFVGISESQQWIRTHNLHGPINVLVWLLDRGTPILVAGSDRGWLGCWIEGDQTHRTAFLLQLRFSINAVAFNKQSTRMAVASGSDLILYQHPLNIDAHPNPIHQWSDEVKGGNAARNIYNIPLVTNLLFTSNGQLIIGYLAGICFATTSYPFKIKSRKMIDLPSRIGRIAISPFGDALAITDLACGIEWFDIPTQAFLGSIDYLPSSQSAKAQYENRILDVSFLTRRFVVAGHYERYIAIIDVADDDAEEPFLIALPPSHENCGTLRVATAFLERRPIVIALNGTEIHIFQIPGRFRTLGHSRGSSTLGDNLQTPARPRTHSLSQDTLSTPIKGLNFDDGERTPMARKSITADALSLAPETPLKSALKHRPNKSRKESNWLSKTMRLILFLVFIATWAALSDEERVILREWLCKRALSLWDALSDIVARITNVTNNSLSTGITDISDVALIDARNEL